MKKKVYEQIVILNIGILFLLSSLLLSIGSYIFSIHFMYYIAFLLLCMAICFMLYAMWLDIKYPLDSSLISFFLIVLLTILYMWQREFLFESAFMLGDSSDYLWSGVSSSLYGNDIGFFPPLTSSLTAVGYQVFGLKNTSIIIVIFYFSALPIIYFIFRNFKFSSIESYMLVLVFQCIPLDIWFSKAVYSEPIWQVMVIILILYTYNIIKKESLSWINLLPLFIILLLAGLTRGSAVILYGLIIFLSLYHYWKYGNIKNAIIIALGMFVLAVSIHYAVSLRSRYFLEWQYSRFIPNITIYQLMIILYSIPLVYMIFLFILRIMKKIFMASNIPLLIVMVSISFKIGIAYYYSSVNNIEFLRPFYQNELSVVIGNYGAILTSMITIGILYIYFEALKGNVPYLILVVVYTLFLIPFTMQNISFDKVHMQLLYWNRYYFSEIFLIHFFALGVFVKSLYDFLGKYFQLYKYNYLWLIFLFPLLFISSIDGKLYTYVTKDGYLENSSDLFIWASKKVKNKNVSIVYSSDISYNHFDAKHLLHKGLYVIGVQPKAYQKVQISNLNNNFIPIRRILKNDIVLCISTQKCILNTTKFIKLDDFSMSIHWREHRRSMVSNKRYEMKIYATIYKILSR